MPIVGVLYVLTNISFFAVLSYDQISNTKAVGLVRWEEGGGGRGEGRHHSDTYDLAVVW